MRVDHIGYAVKNIEKAKKFLQIVGYNFEETIVDADRNIYISFGYMDSYKIELVAPIKGNSPVDSILSKIGAAPYHICYRSFNIEAEIERLTKNGFKLQIPPLPAIAFGKARVAFLYSLPIGLIEIVEEKRKEDLNDVG